MKPKTISFTRRRLPHWDVENRPYFITFRLRNSLPSNVVMDLKNKRELIKSKKDNEEDLLEFQRKQFFMIEKILDSVDNDNNAYLTRDDIAPILMDSLAFIENKYCWRIPRFVIMPNHIHCLCIGDKKGKQIDKIGLFADFKKFTARHINKVLNQKGRVWCDENFDHWCRTPEKVESIKRYIWNNPIKAGFVNEIEDWKWYK